MRGMIPAVRETRIGSEQAVAPIRWLAEAASGAVSVPVACQACVATGNTQLKASQLLAAPG